MFRVLGVSGSLRAGSSNTGLVRMAQRLAPLELKVELYEGIGNLPFYNPDLDQPDVLPEAAARWRSAIIEADAILLALAEYNFGASGVMKNAVDWASRPLPDHPMKGKVMTLMGSGGRRGGPKVQAWAGEILPLLGVNLVTEPEISVAMGAEFIAADGTTTNAELEQLMIARLANVVAALEATDAAS